LLPSGHSPERPLGERVAYAGRPGNTTPRCASLKVLPARRLMPHNGCYRAGHPKGGPVTKPARAEYTEAVRLRYVNAVRDMKSRMLDEYCRTLHCHRKAAIRALRLAPQRRRRPGRRVQYDRRVVPILERIWQISDRLCGKLLVAALPTLVPALERHGMPVGP